jgi:hypothetical protein
MTDRKTREQSASREARRKPADDAAAARQRARDRAGEEGLPRSSGAPKRRASS